MKREIKFRGKDIETGKWMYGFYVRLEDTFRKPIDGKERISHRIYTGFADSCASQDGYDFSGDWYEVDRNTVGQFTGMHDKNGVEIYEGDIVHTEFDTPFGLAKYTGDIFYNNGFDLNIHKVEGEENEGEGVLMLGTDTSGLVVVGNIYENKED